MEPDRELTVKEVCAYCNVSKLTVWNWLRTGRMKGYRAETNPGKNSEGSGVEWRVMASDLAIFLDRWSKAPGKRGRKPKK